MSKERNIATQKMLQAEGLYKGKLDGVIGPLTRKALELHNKQQYQPLPRQRPSGVAMTGSADVGGGPAPEMSARGQVVPGMEPMPPMPDSSAFINDPNPTYGGPNPETSAGIRSGINALLGHDVLINPLRPNYAPQFTGQSGPPPAQPDLQQMLEPLAEALGRFLPRVEPPPPEIGPLSMNENYPGYGGRWGSAPMGPMTVPIARPGSTPWMSPVPGIRRPLDPKPPKPANTA